MRNRPAKFSESRPVGPLTMARTGTLGLSPSLWMASRGRLGGILGMSSSRAVGEAALLNPGPGLLLWTTPAFCGVNRPGGFWPSASGGSCGECRSPRAPDFQIQANELINDCGNEDHLGFERASRLSYTHHEPQVTPEVRLGITLSYQSPSPWQRSGAIFCSQGERTVAWSPRFDAQAIPPTSPDPPR